jgi:hypothetical protein
VYTEFKDLKDHKDHVPAGSVDNPVFSSTESAPCVKQNLVHDGRGRRVRFVDEKPAVAAFTTYPQFPIPFGHSFPTARKTPYGNRSSPANPFPGELR